jgi:hypothetical protein
LLFTRKLSPEYEYGRNQTPDYQFLNRSPRPAVEAIRILLENWLVRMPASEQSRLERSLKSARNTEHWSAFFEMYCHELLVKSGFLVGMHQPENGQRAKDFHAVRNGSVVEVEATICTDSDATKAGHALLDQMMDFLDVNAYLPDFRYMFEVENTTEHLPPLRQLADKIKAWAESFDLADVRQTASDIDNLVTATFDAEGWSIRMTLVPRPTNEDSDGFKRAIVAGPIFGGELHHDSALRNSLKAKASHYADRSDAFVIAVDTIFEFSMHDEIDVYQALFGTEQTTVNARTMKQVDGRAPDGIWYGPKGPRNRHVSAVIVVNQLRTWNIPTAGIRLYNNPWAHNPIVPGLLRVPTVSWDRDSWQKVETPGMEPWQILELSASWPEEA